MKLTSIFACYFQTDLGKRPVSRAGLPDNWFWADSTWAACRRMVSKTYLS
jgi:hypothetical protein